jgi:hypothetical protein
MTYLQRIDYRPSMGTLTPGEQDALRALFNASGAELIIDGQAIRWEHVEEVEVVVAPRIAGPAGWIVKKLLLGNADRYHVGIYYGSREAILPNVTWDVARHVVETVAFYAPNPVRYRGPESLVPLTEI